MTKASSRYVTGLDKFVGNAITSMVAAKMRSVIHSAMKNMDDFNDIPASAIKDEIVAGDAATNPALLETRHELKSKRHIAQTLAASTKVEENAPRPRGVGLRDAGGDESKVGLGLVGEDDDHCGSVAAKTG